MLGKNSFVKAHQDEAKPPQEQTHSNFASVQPSKHPLDLSGRNRNLSLNDLAPSPARVTKMKDSMREQSSEHGGREVRKLRTRVQELQKENLTLHKLLIEYEQEMKDWQERATRLNEQLINYQNKELEAVPSIIRQQQMIPTFNEQENRQLKNTISLLEEANFLHTKRISELSSELEANRRDLSRSHQMETLFLRLQNDYQDALLRLQRQEIKSKETETYIQQLENQLEFTSKEISHKINFIQKEKSQVNQQEKRQFTQEIQKIQRQVDDGKRKLQEQCSQKQSLKTQNRDLRVQLEKILESKSKSSTEVQQLYEEILRLKQKGYEQSQRNQQDSLRKEKQQTTKIVVINHENNTLKIQNERLTDTISHKNRQIQVLEKNVRSLNENSSKITKVEEEKIIAKSQIFKQTHQKNAIYREQIRKLNEQNENMVRQMKKVEAFYLEQVRNVKQESKRQEESWQIRINDMKSAFQKQKEELVGSQQLIQNEVPQLQKIIHEQESQIETLHTRYCAEFDKLMAENASLRRSIQQAQSYRLQERQHSESKIKQYKEYTYTASKLKGQIEQFTYQLDQQRTICAQNEQQKKIYQQQCQMANMRVSEIAKKLKDCELDVETLLLENEKWKAYRLSQEDEARRQTRRYKKRVQELQILLQKQAENNNINDLEDFQGTIEALKQEMIHQEMRSAGLLEAQRVRLNQAMDEMTKEMHNILQECDVRINEKQTQITLLKNRALQLTAINQELKMLQTKNFAAQQQAQQLNGKLQKELLSARNDAIRIQTLLKKQESENLAIKYTSEAQKQIRTRYDKDMQGKVTEIQRLKLQSAQLNDELQRKTIANKKQTQALELSLKTKEEQIRQNQQRISYLQSMIDTYKAENKRFKQFSQQQKGDKAALQNNIDQLVGQLSAETFKFARLKQSQGQQLQQYQCEARQWKQKWETSVKDYRKLESKIFDRDRDHQNKENELEQIQRQLAKTKIQLEDTKQKCVWLQERLNQSSRDGNQLKNIKQSVAQMQQKQATYQSTIESQKQKILVLTKDQGEKMREIQILLSKIDKMEIDLKFLHGELELSDLKKAKRVQCYQGFCNHSLVNSNASRLLFDGDEQLFLIIIQQYLKTFSIKLNQAIEELGKQKRTIMELNEEKQNLNGKYQKYKAVALDYKNRKQVQKELVRNNYRFNEEILHHCQNIIKGDTKR